MRDWVKVTDVDELEFVCVDDNKAYFLNETWKRDGKSCTCTKDVEIECKQRVEIVFDFFKKKKKKTLDQVSSDTSVAVGEEMDHYFLIENDLPKNRL